MVCRNDPEDPRRCERCGQFLWVSEEGLYCGDCGVTMPCTMRLLPSFVGFPTGPSSRMAADPGPDPRPTRPHRPRALGKQSDL